ncbi:hypothetical protein KIH74_32160 [Kineosporia sp. J2-2]|uniref:DUF5671 domain-containing protein n=1 Tax=Kineosporia corallincola TaxID=2835133 RepID=A0ABS5TS59_9ACTN|nr:hypothetical protein [Kineosporia corallincola]MBT0773643.1 hypothetical protein [Kineosporia corallincola]
MPAPSAPTPAEPPPDELHNQTEFIKFAVQVVAPTTVVTALLYYFGYVATRARFAYFGIDLDLLGLSQQALLMRSVGVMFPPLVLALTVVAAGLWTHVTLNRLLASGRHPQTLRRVGFLVIVVGLLVLLRGTAGMVIPSIAENEPPATTPLCLASGALALATGRRILARTSPVAPARGSRYELSAWICVWTIVALGSFWAVNSFAGVYGRGQATVDSERLDERPRVIVDTKESLRVSYPGVREDLLDGPDDRRFGYRSSGWRLYAATGEQMLLIPDGWRQAGTVLLVPVNDDVRVQMYP